MPFFCDVHRWRCGGIRVLVGRLTLATSLRKRQHTSTASPGGGPPRLTGTSSCRLALKVKMAFDCSFLFVLGPSQIRSGWPQTDSFVFFCQQNSDYGRTMWNLLKRGRQLISPTIIPRQKVTIFMIFPSGGFLSYSTRTRQWKTVSTVGNISVRVLQ